MRRGEGLAQAENGAVAEAALIDGFTYAMPPAVPLPQPKAGCARVQPICGCDRIRDGTGVGVTTRSGWWIPTEAHIPKQEAAEPPSAPPCRRLARAM
jgi:hypothetical protein